MTFATAHDPRFTLARPDLADLALEGVVRAASYRAPRLLRCIRPVADLTAGPDAAERIDQLLSGEIFEALDQDETGRRLWGRARRDGVVGWVDGDALEDGAPLALWRQAQAGGAVPLNALSPDPAPGMVPAGEFDPDLISAAERLLGAPHAMGARSSLSTDCSGLVQQALYACGRAGPRWADEQARLGRPVQDAARARNDIIVWLRPGGARPGQSWTGHSALALDATRILHASSHHGAVVIEDFSIADARCLADGLSAAIIRRL